MFPLSSPVCAPFTARFVVSSRSPRRKAVGIFWGLAGFAAVSAFTAATPRAQAAGSIGVYLSKPQATASPYDLTTVEDFSAASLGQHTTDYAAAIGTYRLTDTSAFNIQADNQYGTGTGQYVAFGAQSATSGPITLNLSGPRSYFGFSYNAGDARNGLSFYSGSNFLGRFSTTSLLTLLSGSTVQALDHTVYNSSDYFGKPVAGTRPNSGEPYGFVNFIASGLTFDRIVFDNSGSTGTGFESDNHTVRTDAPIVDQASVFVISVSAPEPGSLPLVGAGLLPLVGGIALRRHRPRRGV